MDLFSFACRNTQNIELGIEHQMWAVATLNNLSAMAARVTKAEKYLRPGAFGVLYCNPLHAFTTPFIVESRADPHKVITDIWPEPWRLPFKIKTLGTLSRTVSMEDAARRWPSLRARLAANDGRGGVSAAFNITGTTVFVPVDITEEDWSIICGDLAQ
ncbi:MAG TPA: hypothetical protein P5032_04445 [Candidatus Competibacter sp.]|nr:hypothetical protein [Candidatus Competibacteraceae bacterium]HRW64987.1 hypothetical protein [Candidatus Competibacter sp.]